MGGGRSCVSMDTSAGCLAAWVCPSPSLLPSPLLASFLTSLVGHERDTGLEGRPSAAEGDTTSVVYQVLVVYYRGLRHKGNKISHALSILCNTPICELHTPLHTPARAGLCTTRTTAHMPHTNTDTTSKCDNTHTSRILKYRSEDGFSPQPKSDVNDVSHARPIFSYACGDLLVFPLTHKSKGVIQGYKPSRGGVKPCGRAGVRGEGVGLCMSVLNLGPLPFLFSS